VHGLRGTLLLTAKNGDGVDFARFLEIIGVEIVRFVILALAFAKGCAPVKYASFVHNVRKACFTMKLLKYMKAGQATS